VRFALENQATPNFEIKFTKNNLARGSFKDRLTVITKLGEIYISSLERQIAFKRYYLKSYKDIEDAVYLENLFKGKLDRGEINKHKRLLSRKNGKSDTR